MSFQSFVLRHLMIAPILNTKKPSLLVQYFLLYYWQGKPFRRKEETINLHIFHLQEREESKLSKKEQVTVEMASLRQADVTQDMASTNHNLFEVRRKCLSFRRPYLTYWRMWCNTFLLYVRLVTLNVTFSWKYIALQATVTWKIEYWGLRIANVT